MELKTLGDLKLEPHNFQERMPLLLLAYISLEGESSRSKVAELFWMHKENSKQLRSLDEALRRLRKGISPDVVKTVSGTLQTSIRTDVHKLRDAIVKKDYQKALALYKGAFFKGLERYKRLELSNELEEWIFNTREDIHNQIREAMLSTAEAKALQEKFAEASEFAWKAFKLSTEAAYPDPDDFRRIYTLVLAAELSEEAKQVKETAEGLYAIDELNFAKHPTEARQRLTFAFLPRQNTHFLGREQQLSEILELLSHHPLVTIVGLGGVGKSSLAIALAWSARKKSFSNNGLHFVALEALPVSAKYDALVSIIIQTMGLSFPEGQFQQENLIEYIADKHILLVLDNFEHLKQQALLVDTLLKNCPNLKVLITSREVLGLDEEYVFELQGLPYPTNEYDDLKFNQLQSDKRTDIAAIKLFEGYAKQRGFHLTDDNLASVVTITQLVEGLPLGIRLAASWAHKCPCEVIVENIKESLDFLGRANSLYKERHSSLRTTIDFSFNLLTEQGKTSLCKNRCFFWRVYFGSSKNSGLSSRKISCLSSLKLHYYGMTLVINVIAFIP